MCHFDLNESICPIDINHSEGNCIPLLMIRISKFFESSFGKLVILASYPSSISILVAQFDLHLVSKVDEFLIKLWVNLTSIVSPIPLSTAWTELLSRLSQVCLDPHVLLQSQPVYNASLMKFPSWLAGCNHRSLWQATGTEMGRWLMTSHLPILPGMGDLFYNDMIWYVYIYIIYYIYI